MYDDNRGGRSWDRDERRRISNTQQGWRNDTERGVPDDDDYGYDARGRRDFPGREHEWHAADWGSGGGYGQGGVNWGARRVWESGSPMESDNLRRDRAPYRPGNLGPQFGRNMDYTTARSFGDYPPGRSHSGRGPRGYRRADARILEDICEDLTIHPGLDASDVEVTVTNGEVTLSGEVENRHDKKLAEDIAERASGVMDVHNRLKARHGLLSNLFGPTDGHVPDHDRNDREVSKRTEREKIGTR